MADIVGRMGKSMMANGIKAVAMAKVFGRD
jgi:hypothetical protein